MRMNLMERIRGIWFNMNRGHKDVLFRTIFGKRKYKKYALQLYNAVNNSNYTNEDDLEIITLENAVLFRVAEDVSYLMMGDLTLYEHQSTPNPNMPLRGLIYFGDLYNRYVRLYNVNIYGKSLKKIPTPQFIVFYNGMEEEPEVKKLKLSDAFMNPRSDGEFEWTATVYNINAGKNKDLFSKCEALKGYSIYVAKVRKFIYNLGMSRRMAVRRAVDECISEGILVDIFTEERAAIMMEALYTIYWDKYDEELREEGRAEGREEERRRLDCVIQEKDAEIIDLQTEIRRLRNELTHRD